MEVTDSSTKDVNAQGTPIYYPCSCHEVMRAFYRCLGLETKFQQNPSCLNKEEDDGKVNNKHRGCQESPVASFEEGADSASSTFYSDPPSTVTDTTTDPFSSTGEPSVVVYLSAPKRPGTSNGEESQIN